MLLKQIKYFTAIVDCNSFTEAAEICFISQSAISQQMQALEKELGVELIHRENRRFSLTSAGEYFYRHGRALLAEAENIRSETIRIGKDDELHLRIGYPKHYSGAELNQAIALFSEKYPEVSISITNGTHEELYSLLRTGGVDLAINDQRRAFSDEYVNFELIKADCYAEISIRNHLSKNDSVTIQDLKSLSCILITSKEQQRAEREYYQQTLGFGGSFLYADNLEEGRLMVTGNRGFMPIENVGTIPRANPAAKQLPIVRGNRCVQRNYCAFWKVENSGYYIEEFANILKELLCKN